MVVAKVCRFLAMSVLPFILLVHFTVACVLDPVAEPKKYYCGFEIVIGGTYVDTWKEETPINTFKIIKLVKGPCVMNQFIKINTADKSNCSYHPRDVNQSFIVVAGMKNGQIVCIRNQTSISSFERAALESIYNEGCANKPTRPPPSIGHSLGCVRCLRCRG